MRGRIDMTRLELAEMSGNGPLGAFSAKFLCCLVAEEKGGEIGARSAPRRSRLPSRVESQETRVQNTGSQVKLI